MRFYFVIATCVMACSPFPAVAAATMYFHQLDHLAGQSITTDVRGRSVESVDYTPFGETRFDIAQGFTEQRKFNGQQNDRLTSLLYFGARYADPRTSRFLSIDPAIAQPTQEMLADPQLLQAYAVARNNPLRFEDVKGEAARDFHLYPPARLVINSSGIPLMNRGREVYVYQSGDKMGTYKGVPIWSNGGSVGTARGNVQYQCVALVKHVYRSVYGVSIGKVDDAHGMADLDKLNRVSVFSGNQQFVGYNNRETLVRPKDDDIITWKGGQFGHVGIIASVYFNERSNRGYVDAVEQNWGRAGVGTPITRLALSRDAEGRYTIANHGNYQTTSWIRLQKK